MEYMFRCFVCNRHTLESMPMESAKETIQCLYCDSVAHRVFTAPNIKVPKLEPAYNPAFGRVIHGKRDLQNELARIKHEEGRELVELGNDKIESAKPKPLSWTQDDYEKSRQIIKDNS